MKRKGLLRILCVGLAVHLALPRFAGADSYRAGPSDELRVSVRLRGGLDDLGKLPVNSSLTVLGDGVYSQHDVRVGPDGAISLPTVHSLVVSGMTLTEIEKAVGSLCCSRDVPGAVTVSLLQPAHSAYFVTGEVGHPGRYVMLRPMTVLEAVASAGGPTSFARLKKVQILRQGSPSVSLDLSLLRHVAESEFNQDSLGIKLQPHDTIVVPRKRGLESSTLMLLLSVISVATGVYIAGRVN
ncbi:MAG: SLBB domain-containing protein [Elusimicrobia bacterium]|nr:SLBB domain-containing protein [Elusimicrobiota bacterium]